LEFASLRTWPYSSNNIGTCLHLFAPDTEAHFVHNHDLLHPQNLVRVHEGGALGLDLVRQLAILHVDVVAQHELRLGRFHLLFDFGVGLADDGEEHVQQDHDADEDEGHEEGGPEDRVLPLHGHEVEVAEQDAEQGEATG